MKIIKATIQDLSEINKLNEKYFKEIRDFRKVIESDNDYFYVGVADNKVVGFSGFHYYAWNNSAAIIDIFIKPSFRRKGYASKFIKKIVINAKKLKARVIIAEAPSLNNVLKVYIKNGFRVCGYNERYYSNIGKEIAIFLSLDLD